jgi:hypothetical protein
MKPLDMADKYEPLSYTDEHDRPTVKVQSCPVIPLVTVSDPGEDEYFDLHGTRDTIPCPPPYPQPYEVRYPGVGILLALGTGLLFWGTVAYFIFR